MYNIITRETPYHHDKKKNEYSVPFYEINQGPRFVDDTSSVSSITFQ